MTLFALVSPSSALPTAMITFMILEQVLCRRLYTSLSFGYREPRTIHISVYMSVGLSHESSFAEQFAWTGLRILPSLSTNVAEFSTTKTGCALWLVSILMKL